MKRHLISALLINLGMSFGLSIPSFAGVIADCNNGAMLLTTTPRSGFYQVIVKDQGVVRFFKQKIAQTANARALYTREVGENSLLVSELQTEDGFNFSSGQFGPKFNIDLQNGGRLTLTYFNWLDHRRYEAFEIANWYFESCKRSFSPNNRSHPNGGR